MHVIKNDTNELKIPPSVPTRARVSKEDTVRMWRDILRWHAGVRCKRSRTAYTERRRCRLCRSFGHNIKRCEKYDPANVWKRKRLCYAN